MARRVSPRTLAVQRALGALAIAAAALGAASVSAHAHPLAAAPARPAAAPLGDGGLSDFTGPLVQVETLGGVPAVDQVGGFLSGGG
ncbi:hypothetical protein AB0E10_17775 [Streptomyces sp. NPDC048045]|uniref:hypothetical protein n=1 Tax=Streptomyces sp. NPDC048045 TaxID=3154710 RepID=UPI00343C8210